MNTPSPGTTPDLQTVNLAFTQWRKSGESKSRTPVELQRQCVALLQYHSRAELCRTLGIAYGALNQWVERAERGELDSGVVADENRQAVTDGRFVPLPRTSSLDPIPDATEAMFDQTRLHIAFANGTTVSATVPMSLLMQMIHSPGITTVTGGRNE